LGQADLTVYLCQLKILRHEVAESYKILVYHSNLKYMHLSSLSLNLYCIRGNISGILKLNFQSKEKNKYVETGHLLLQKSLQYLLDIVLPKKLKTWKNMEEYK